jgi:hypothetical protein
MMTKWDTIQADVADAYIYLDEELAQETIAEEEDFFGHELISLDEIKENELTLDWEASE